MTAPAAPSGSGPSGAPETVSQGAEMPMFGSSYRRYAMGLLLAIYIINFLDRQVINILAEPIKNDLKLADWQLGLMSGLAFALFYTVLGIPIARLAERRSRPAIIGVAVAVWSGFTALCGTAQNFAQLLLYRIGVGVGEAGCTPPAHSLITDYVPKEKRASALAFYSMGTPLGSLLGLVLGGLMADAFGWRAAFLLAGVPGLLFAVLAITTLREPRKLLSDEMKRVQDANRATFGETLKYLTTKRTFWLLSAGTSVKAFIGYGYAPFIASFFLRNHGEEVERLAGTVGLQSLGFLGLVLGIVGGIAGAISTYMGGLIADRYAKTDLRGYVVVPAIASLINIPIIVGVLLAPTPQMAILLMVFNGLLGSLWYGPVYATAQSIVPPHMRATASAILLFIVNLVGLGLGPLAVGALSDVLANSFGMGSAEGVRWALIVAGSFGIFAFLTFWMARTSIREDMVS